MFAGAAVKSAQEVLNFLGNLAIVLETMGYLSIWSPVPLLNLLGIPRVCRRSQRYFAKPSGFLALDKLAEKLCKGGNWYIWIQDLQEPLILIQAFQTLLTLHELQCSREGTKGSKC
jgi:hypothetical protein